MGGEGNDGMGEEEEAASGSVAKEAFPAGFWSCGFWDGGLGAAIVSSAGILLLAGSCGGLWRLVEAQGDFPKTNNFKKGF